MAEPPDSALCLDVTLQRGTGGWIVHVSDVRDRIYTATTSTSTPFDTFAEAQAYALEAVRSWCKEGASSM